MLAAMVVATEWSRHQPRRLSVSTQHLGLVPLIGFAFWGIGFWQAIGWVLTD